MTPALSNIAWTAENDDRVADVMKTTGVTALEVAPGRLFTDPSSVSDALIRSARRAWEERGIRIVSMQALLFGHPEFNIFGEASVRNAMADYLARIFRMAGLLGCGPLVFGSPKNRSRGGLSWSDALEIAVPFFRGLADCARENGCILCLEPNARDYVCDFVTTLSEAAELVRAVGHESFAVHADSGNMAMAGEGPAQLDAVLPLVKHFHASAPHLRPIVEHRAGLGPILNTLRRGGYRGHVTIEMRTLSSREDVANVKRCLSCLLELLEVHV